MFSPPNYYQEKNQKEQKKQRKTTLNNDRVSACQTFVSQIAGHVSHRRPKREMLGYKDSIYKGLYGNPAGLRVFFKYLKFNVVWIKLT